MMYNSHRIDRYYNRFRIIVSRIDNFKSTKYIWLNTACTDIIRCLVFVLLILLVYENIIVQFILDRIT